MFSAVSILALSQDKMFHQWEKATELRGVASGGFDEI